MCRRSKIPIVLILGVAGFVLRSHGTLPDNDNFATRFVLVGTNVTAGGSNAGATEEPGEPDPSLLGEKSVWWTWTAPRDGGLTLTTTGSDFDTMLTLFTGNSLTNLTFVAFNDEDPLTTNTSRITMNVAAGMVYQIAVDGYIGATGQISLQLVLGPLVPPPPNDNFADRITLTGTHLVNVSGSNVGASTEPGEPFHADVLGGKSVWWTWTAPSSGRVTLITRGSSFDTVLGVYTGNSVANLVFVAGNDDDPLSSDGVESRATFPVTGGIAYQIAVDGYDGVSGDILLRLDLDSALPVPANDNFANRIPLTGGDITTNGSNVDATFETGEPMHLDIFGGKSVWWTWTAPSSGGVTLTTSGSSFDTLLCVYEGNSVSNLVFVAGNDDDPLSSDAVESRATFPVTGGTAYEIAVDGYDGASGDITLHLALGSADPVPANDDFANAIALTGTNVTVTGSNAGATFEVGEPLPDGAYGGKSIWWRWTAPGPGFVTVDTIGSVYDTELAVYTGSSVSNLVQIASDDESGGDYTSLVTFTTKSNVTYRIAVDGYDGDFGDTTLHVRFTPVSYSLTVSANPPSGGSVSISPPAEPDGNYAPGEVVTLTATPVAGSAFTDWTGNITSTNNPVVLTMNSDKTIAAGFSVQTAPTLAAYQLQSPESIRTNGFQLLLTGLANFSYALEGSSNFTDWISFQTNLAVSNQVELRDTTAGKAPVRFYRVRLVQ